MAEKKLAEVLDDLEVVDALEQPERRKWLDVGHVVLQLRLLGAALLEKRMNIFTRFVLFDPILPQAATNPYLKLSHHK